MEILTLQLLREAVSGDYAAVRRVTRLEPQGAKIYPPTYEGGEYATESRRVKATTEQPDLEDARTTTVETVLLDSVQSQANRMEMALLRAYDAGKIKMPLLQVNFAGVQEGEATLAEIGRITALEAPHRFCDAIFRDSTYTTGEPFRNAGAGAKLNAARPAFATPVFEFCPTALLFGFWDSTGPRGGLGAKVQRAIVSEIVGYESVSGKRPASRIDPLQIDNKVDVFARPGGGWTLEEGEAERKNNEPVKLKWSKFNHGNVKPSLRHEDETTKKQVLNHGGVTIAYAEQQTFVSIAALRRLSFPLEGQSSAVVDDAARTVLAALGLAAICFLDEDGYDLRSRCLLDGKPGIMEFVGRGETKPFHLDADAAAQILEQAIEEAKRLKLPWPEEPVTLRPSKELAKLVVESRKRSMSAAAGE